MPSYRRARVPGGTFFFTVRCASRGDAILVDRIDALRTAYRGVAREMPFETVGIVVLPDHLHAVWRLPGGDTDFSTRWKRIKREFTVWVGETRTRGMSQARKSEAGLWQRRFWERVVRDEAQEAAALRYMWTNPVKHGWCETPGDWPYSSFRGVPP